MLQSATHVSERLILNSRRASGTVDVDGGQAAATPRRRSDTDPSDADQPFYTASSFGRHQTAAPPTTAPLDVIEIAWTPITKDIAATIVQLLVDDDDTKPPIRVVDLVDNRLGPELTATIAAAMDGSQVEEIILRFNEIGKGGCDAVASVINVSTRLRHVDLRGNHLGPLDVRKLLRSISVSQSLQRLGLSNNQLGPEGAALITAALEKNSFVTYLDVSMNSIVVGGIESIGSLLALPAHPLRHLNVWGNRLGAAGMDALMAVVAKNRSLTTLSAGNNNGGPQSAVSIGKMLAENTSLQSLELRCNSMDVGSLLPIAEGLAQNEALTSLQLSGNPFSAGGTSSGQLSASLDGLVKHLLRNETLTALDMASCALGTIGIIRLAGLIAASTTLSELTLSDNGAEDEAATALAKAIVSAKSLTSLDLSANRITMEGATDILESVQGNHRVAHLSLHGNAEINTVVQSKVDGLVAERRRR